jgi:hypothetical protein
MTDRELDSVASNTFKRVFDVYNTEVKRWKVEGVQVSVDQSRPAMTQDRAIWVPPQTRRYDRSSSFRVTAGHPYPAQSDDFLECHVADLEEQPYDCLFVVTSTGEEEGLTSDVVNSWPGNVQRPFERLARRQVVRLHTRERP